jgi:hypothetical protein
MAKKGTVCKWRSLKRCFCHNAKDQTNKMAYAEECAHLYKNNRRKPKKRKTKR